MASETKKRKKRIPRLTREMQNRLIIAFLLIVVLLIGLSGRLMYICYASGEKYEKNVLSQQQYDSKTIPYQRGDIVDSKGTVLATSIAVYNVILDCYVLTSKEAYLEPTIEALLECFSEYGITKKENGVTTTEYRVTKEKLYNYAEEQPENRYIVLAKELSYDAIQKFKDIQAETVFNEETNKDELANPNVQGVWFEKEYKRQYPYGTFASSVIGFTAAGNVGVNGLENYYSSTLNGIDGRQFGYLNSESDFEKTIKEPTHGNTIVTTLDITIQKVVEEKILEFNNAYKNNYREGEGATHIAVIVMDPNNGDVLAMANYPNYDLNNPKDLSAYYSEEEWNAMSDDDKLKKQNELWQNFCVYFTYEPGSTAKAFTIAAGLESGAVFEGDSYYCDGSEKVAGYSKPISCVKRVGHGMQTLGETLMNSCNDALMQMASKIGIENFARYQQIFGFGQKTNIDLPGEARTDGLIHQGETMKKVDLAISSFGQGFNCTMIQMVNSFCSLINGGRLYQPRMVKAVADVNGNIIEEKTPTLLRETVSKQTSESIKSYLYDTVSDGTGKTAKVDGYSLGGKTGTAEKKERDDENYVVSFIGFAPVEDPELVIYCVIDEPNVDDQPHSTFAQNIVREILEEILPYMGIYPDEETTGLHKGWGITGEDIEQIATTDIMIETLLNKENEVVEDLPDTMDDLPNVDEIISENLENDGVDEQAAALEEEDINVDSDSGGEDTLNGEEAE